ncbi:phosphoribosylaminoimidazolesuccinocarboxamide synthase [Planctomycetales bacterium ZRK34]|nr:phosphoribosylaminoimidazolesuccinocarboxamide synthase [Planctomycetales bacterium ZRK34]
MPNAADALMKTDLPLANRRQGKVRDIYDMSLADGSDALLIVATDRISAFDVVMANGVPGKGAVLTQISKFWFNRFASVMPHHLLSTDPADIPGLTAEQRAPLKGRIMICRKTKVVPIECVVRGYLTGSGYKDYLKTGAVCGIELPQGMVNSSKIEQPIFTPSTKAETGHDENISFAEACDIVGEKTMNTLRDNTLKIYTEGREYAAGKGIIIADTKFEFGVPVDAPDSAPILIDEVLTPDSSRFWLADDYEAGREQNSLDKQFVRNYLEGLVKSGQWDKTPPGPALPDDVIENTLAKYLDAYRRLTGNDLAL